MTEKREHQLRQTEPGEIEPEEFEPEEFEPEESEDELFDHGGESGWVVLIELLISMCVILIVCGMAIPSTFGLMRAQNQQFARQRVRQVSMAIAARDLCSISGCSSAATDPLIPSPGTLETYHYDFTYTSAGANWTYQASPSTFGGNSGTISYWVDQTSIMRCQMNTTATATATATSPICQ